jgi:serine beta-lactamase-like protein LACTB, mitochondrial
MYPMFRNFLLLFICFCTSFLFPQNQNKIFEDYLVNYYLAKKVPSVSAGFLNNGKIQWVSTKGFSDLENSVPATNKTLYRIASISKPMTAVAIMQLVEAGRINLDDHAKKYIPYLPSTKRQFSVRQLLNHTSGIRTYRDDEFDSKNYFSSTKDVVLYIMKDTLDYTPGDKYVYSTLGYNLLAAIIENVSGMEYAGYMKTYIFDPSDMQNTIPDYQKTIIQNRARGYTRDAYRQIQNAPLADLSIKYAGGGILSTSEDLLKFSLNILNGKLIKPETLDSMLVPSRLSTGRYINYGLGFSFETDETGRKFFSHIGGATGFSSSLVIYPVENIAAVYLTNIRDRALEDPSKTVISISRERNGFNVKRSLSDRLMEEYFISTIDTVIALYTKIEADSIKFYNVTETEMNYFGYDLIAINRMTDAIEFFKFFVSEYPEYAPAYIGLADAYYADGNRGLALKNYRIAYKLDPRNNYILSMVKKINGNR